MTRGENVEPKIKVYECIKNRRLFEAASGTTKLEDGERVHIHECRICQSVLQVFIKQHTAALIEGSKRGGFAA